MQREFKLSKNKPVIEKAQKEAQTVFLSKEEEFTQAVCLGLFDYLRKSKSNGFVISLSGGADSSAVAILAVFSFHLAWNTLGKEKFLSKLSYIKEFAECTSPEEVVSKGLVCVYQATKNSSAETRAAASTLAKALYARYLEFEVEDIVCSYRQKVEAALGREFSWESDDIVLQNIQARVRGPGAWMIANAENALLLATSNRSEASVGYTTMDGDTCGSISPIAGIDKAFLLSWLLSLEKNAPRDLFSISELSLVNSLSPTAELRPLDKTQRDEADLMPYEVLDKIEELAIGEKLHRDVVLSEIEKSFSLYSKEELQTWVSKFFLFMEKKPMEARALCAFFSPR